MKDTGIAFGQEAHEMTGQLQYRDISIKVQAVDAFALENNMLVEYSIDVRYWDDETRLLDSL